MKNIIQAHVIGVASMQQSPAALLGSEYNALLCDSVGCMATMRG